MEAEIKIKSDNNIQKKEIRLKPVEDILRLYIKDEEGNDTGNYLEFDLLNPNYLLDYQRLIEEDKKNRMWFNSEINRINKMQDKKGKKLYSYKEEEMLKTYAEFNKKTKEVYNMFLGANGIEKLLNGRAISLNTLKEIDRIIEEVIAPELELNAKELREKIMEKYSSKKSSDVIE